MRLKTEYFNNEIVQFFRNRPKIEDVINKYCECRNRGLNCADIAALLK